MRHPIVANVVAGTAVLVMFGTFVLAVLHFNVFTSGGPDGGTQAIAAAIALVGGFLTAVVSILGILLKYSVDARAEQRLQDEAKQNAALREVTAERARLDAERNAILQRDAERRLRLEVATQAVKLLTSSDGGLATSLQRSGALFTLVNLGESELTLSLVTELIKQSELEPAVAARLLNSTFLQGSERVRNDAAWLIYEHADFFLTPSGFEFPSALLDDLKSFSTYVREWTCRAWAKMILGRSLQEWREQMDVICALIAALSLAWINEPDDRLRKDLAAILRPIVAAFPEARRINNPIQSIDLLRIRAETTVSEGPVTAGVPELSRALSLWSGVVPA